MPELFHDVDDIENIEEIFGKMSLNCPDPCTKSVKLWLLNPNSELD